MRLGLLALAAAGIGALFLLPKRANAAQSNEAAGASNPTKGKFMTPADIPDTPAAPNLDDLFVKYGDMYGVDAALLKAISRAESNGNPNAIRNNPPNDVSVGLMQILCIPDANGFCTNNFNVEGWQGMTFDALKDPETNIAIGAQILAWNIEQFGMPRAIAVYNNWSARKSPQAGPFPNQAYVNRVLNFYAQARA